MSILAVHREDQRARCLISCACRPPNPTYLKGTDGRRDAGQCIICWCGDGLEEGGTRHMPGVFGISNGCTVPALVSWSSFTECESYNFVGLLLLVLCCCFRRIYSHVSKYFFGREMLLFFLLEIGVDHSRAYAITGESSRHIKSVSFQHRGASELDCSRYIVGNALM